MSASEDMQERSDAVAAEIGKIRDALRDGRPVETERLAGLVEEIHALSTRLAPAEAATARPRLLGLLADLDLVQAEMNAAHAALQTELAGTTVRHRAVSAYSRPRDT